MRKFVLFICLSLFATKLIAAPETWTIKAPMIVAKTTCGAAFIDSVIYVIGGGDTAGATTSNYAYNINTNTWSIKAPMTTARVELGVATVNGKIYAIGGYDGSGATNKVEEYNPATNTWTTKTPMPTARSQFSITVIANKIYAIGGWPGAYATLEVYDPATDTWSTKAPEPFGRIQLDGAVTLGGKLYFLGGKDYSTGTWYDSVSVYNPATNLWSVADTMPYHRYAGTAAVLKHRIYYFGGTAGGTTYIPPFDNSNYYDSADGTWHTALTMLKKRSNGVAVAANGSIYVIGGLDTAGHIMTDNHQYTPSNVGVNEIVNNGSGEVVIYPNPCKNYFSMFISSPSEEEAQIEIVNMLGEKIKGMTISTKKLVQIQVDLLPGIYTIITSTPKNKYTNKLIIQ